MTGSLQFLLAALFTTGVGAVMIRLRTRFSLLRAREWRRCASCGRWIDGRHCPSCMRE